MRLLEYKLRGVMAWIHYLVGITHRYYGNAHSLQSEYEEAIAAFSRSIEMNPEYARAYLARGILLWREMDQPRHAILDLTTAYTLDPTLIEARFNRGIAHQQLREYAEAIADFRAYLAEGDHPYWREYAESMIQELTEWVSDSETVA